MTDWMPNLPYSPGDPSAPVGGVGAVIFRDPLDARRSMQGARVPAAEYPSGYLGAMQSRREDRILDKLKRDLKQRSYQRGVHVGERADPSAYFWPPELDPYTAGITRQLMTGMRAAPLMTMTEEIEAFGRPRSDILVPVNPQKASDLRSLAPGWS